MANNLAVSGSSARTFYQQINSTNMEEQRYVLLFKLLETSLLYRANVLFDRLEHWVHPINQQRETFGEFHHLVPELKQDESRFNSYFIIESDNTIYFSISSVLQVRHITLASECLSHLKE